METPFDIPGTIVTPDGDIPLAIHSSTSFRDRLVGLIGRDGAGEGHAMLFPGCRSLHTCFMRSRIDVMWLAAPDDDGLMACTGIVRSLVPWRLAIAPPCTRSALELDAGALDGLVPGSLAVALGDVS